MSLKNKLLQLTLAVGLASGTGCGALTYHYEQNENYAGPRTLTEDLSRRFRYNRGRSHTLEDTILVETEHCLFYSREKRTFRTYDVHLDRERTVAFEYYRTKLVEQPPLVLVAPILGGAYVVERPICELLAENGISVVLVHRPRGFMKPEQYPSLEHLMLSLVSDRRKVLDIIAGSGDIDANNVGSFGISMGAITNIPLAAVEPRIKCHIFGLAGGDVPSILLESSESSVEDTISRHTAQSGVESLMRYLRKNYTTDPLELAPFIDARNTRMFLAYFDTVVPIKYGTALRVCIGQPETNILPTGHYTAALYYFWIRDMIVDSFQNWFDIDACKIDEEKNKLLPLWRRRVS